MRQERCPQKTTCDGCKVCRRNQRKGKLAAAEPDGGRSQIASLVQDLLAPISGELASQQEQSESGIVNMAEQARQGIESQRSSALSNVDSLEQNRPKHLSKPRRSKPYSSSKTPRKACIDALRPAGETMKANILNAASGFGQQYSA